MKKAIHAALIAALLLGLAAGAEAQTVYGPGGLFIHGTADVPPRGAVGLNISWFSQQVGSARPEWMPVSLTYGVGGRAEVGVLYVNELAHGSHHDSEGVFGKYLLVRGSATHPAIAIDGSFLGGFVRSASLEAVASQWLRIHGRSLARVDLGVAWARRADIPISADGLSPFVGLEVPVARGLRLVGEIGTKFPFDRKEASALGVMWSAPFGATIALGYVNIGRGDANRFFVGVGYKIGR